MHRARAARPQEEAVEKEEVVEEEDEEDEEEKEDGEGFRVCNSASRRQLS
jgi:hypothetical protein